MEAGRPADAAGGPSESGLSEFLEAEYAGCVAEWAALLEVWPEDDMPTIEAYERRIAKAEHQMAEWRQDAATATNDKTRESLLNSIGNMQELTARHRAKLAELRGDTVGQMPLFGEAAA